MKYVLLAALCLTACARSGGGIAKVGAPQKGTKHECAGTHKVVTDPALCALQK